MKIASIFFLTLAMVAGSFSAFAADMSNETFYQKCIDKTVAKYENKAENLTSDRSAIKRDAAVACLKAAYFKSHRDALFNEMCAHSIPPEKAKVDYFMTKSFGEHMGDRLDQAVAEVMQEGSAKEIYEAYSEEKK